MSKSKIVLFLVVIFSLIIVACGNIPLDNNTEAISTPWMPPSTPTTDPVLADKYACTFEHHGTTFTVPFTEVNEYDRYEVSRIKPTEFTYTYRNVEWKMGVTCHHSTGHRENGPFADVVFDMPQKSEGGEYFQCANTEIVVYGAKVANSSCDVVYPNNGLIHVTIDGGYGPEDLTLKWNWEKNSNTDTYTSPLILQYQFSGNHITSGAPSNLVCYWITWNDYNGWSSSGARMNLVGKEVGYFGFSERSETDVICAGDGYTVTLTAK